MTTREKNRLACINNLFHRFARPHIWGDETDSDDKSDSSSDDGDESDSSSDDDDEPGDGAVNQLNYGVTDGRTGGASDFVVAELD